MGGSEDSSELTTELAEFVLRPHSKARNFATNASRIGCPAAFIIYINADSACFCQTISQFLPRVEARNDRLDRSRPNAVCRGHSARLCCSERTASLPVCHEQKPVSCKKKVQMRTNEEGDPTSLESPSDRRPVLPNPVIKRTSGVRSAPLADPGCGGPNNIPWPIFHPWGVHSICGFRSNGEASGRNHLYRSGLRSSLALVLV